MKKTATLRAIIATENERQEVYKELLDSGDYLPMEARRKILWAFDAKLRRLWAARRSEKVSK